MRKGGQEEMKLNGRDWGWLIFDICIMIFFSYLGIVEQDASLWYKIMYMAIAGVSGINVGITLGKGSRLK